MLKIDLEAEKKEIQKRYRALLKACKPTMEKGDKRQIRLAFEMSVEAHKNMRRKSGEPYIYHPIAVAQIAAEEIGLGTTSIVCALLHDVVEDTNITLEDIEREFGKKVSNIIDGLTKISGVFDQTSSIQAENFRKMLLTLADDVRVILIKLADRLHNMRTLDSMPRDKQLKISSETIYLYAPLAHRLGLYTIKSELEDLSMKFTETSTYKFIATKLNETRGERAKFIKEFITPIKDELNKLGLESEILGRPKSIHSIWKKMKSKGIPFEEVYDLFAIRIILESNFETEKADCWKAYSIVTDKYIPNPDRLRDWVSSPKGNGYESLHTTVMGPSGKWVEVQIRSRRMNEIAEKGFAAHWKYKEQTSENGLDQWIQKVRDVLNSTEANALDFLDDFKMNLFSDEIFIFTPKGDLIKLPFGATALDFAFEIHSNLGTKCIGAKVNHKLVPLSHELQNGDQVEVISSDKQKPKEDWLNFVITSKAKSKIKSVIKEQKVKIAEDGKELLDRKLKSLKLTNTIKTINKIALFLGYTNNTDLFYNVALGKIDMKELREFQVAEKKTSQKSPNKIDKDGLEQYMKQVKSKDSDILVIGEDLHKIDYKLSPCCNPIPGDDVFGFVTINEGIKIHRTNCPNAIKLMSNFGYRIVKAKWTGQKEIAFLTGIRLTGTDDVGVVNNITKVVSNDFKVNMRSITVDSDDGIFEGTLMVYVNDTSHLDTLIKKLKLVNGVINVSRFDANNVNI
jgi:guanosine-3',5'-bis(diphosphate) 3'-pyrophosphohydrolase